MGAAGLEPVRVVQVLPDPEFARWVETGLEEADLDFDVTTVRRAARARDVLDREDVDCVVSAQELPDADGLAFLERVREAHPGCPCVLLGEDDGGTLALDALATDHLEYVRRPAGRDALDRLATRIRSVATFARMQRYLREQQLPFRALVEYSTDVVSILEPDGTIAYVSPSIDHRMGYHPTELVGRSSFEFVHPEDREAVRETFYDAVANPDQRPVVEYRFRHADGDWRVVESRGSNKLEDPAIEGFVVNTRDVTERKRMEESLREREARMERLQAAAAELVDCGTARAVCDCTAEAATDLVAADACVVALAADGELSTAAATGVPEEESTLSLQGTAAAEVYRTGEPRLVADARDVDAAVRPAGYLSAVCVPVGVHGVVQATAESAGAFDAGDLDRVELLVTHVAAALTRVERDAALRDATDRLETRVADASDALERVRASTAVDPSSDALEAVERAHGEIARAVAELESLTGEE